MTKKRKPLSPQEQLANVDDSLADDVFDVPLDTDKKTNERATRIARAAIDEALSSGQASEGSPKEWTERTGNDEPPVKGRRK